jgi:hypothetical protein
MAAEAGDTGALRFTSTASLRRNDAAMEQARHLANPMRLGPCHTRRWCGLPQGPPDRDRAVPALFFDPILSA